VTGQRRVIVCDERALIATSLVALVDGFPDTAWVRSASSLEEVLRIARGGADLVVLGAGVGRLSFPMDVLRGLRQLAQRPRALLLVDEPDLDVIVRALELGADGACLSRSGPAALRQAMDSVLAGQVSLPDELVGEIVLDLRDASGRVHRDRRSLERLTDRETQVLEMLCEGHGREQIAHDLGLSTSTVRSHVQHVMQKLGVHNQLHAAAEGRRLLADRDTD
jgi:DNA-binding NarL/FixJ family response regulator